MADNDKVSSFNESGYFRGPLKIIFSDNLEREADEQDKWLASIPNGSGISVGRILLTILQEAVLAKASYIHIDPRQSEFFIRYRIGDRLWEANAFPMYPSYSAFCARLKRIFSVNIAERRIPQFGRLLYEQEGFLYELRMCSIPTQIGETFVINIVQQSGHGDYTAERHQELDQMSLEEIYTRILTKRQERTE